MADANRAGCSPAVRSDVADVPVRTILVPTDFSPSAEAAFGAAAEFAEAYGAKIVLVHVGVEPFIPGVSVLPSVQIPDSLQAEIRVATDKALARAKKKFGDSIVVEVQIVDGPPHVGICDAAVDRRADLIVMATEGSSGLARLFLGSTAQRVLRSAPCPVVTVRPGSGD
jgi:nucleotide-binding universal stress UspA family protein